MQCESMASSRTGRGNTEKGRHSQCFTLQAQNGQQESGYNLHHLKTFTNYKALRGPSGCLTQVHVGRGALTQKVLQCYLQPE